MKKPIRFWTSIGYRPFTLAWLNELSRHVLGIYFYRRESWRPIVDWPMWGYDLHAYWHRARYGWAPRDTWSLDRHMDRVFAGALWHLAEHSNGAPASYPRQGVVANVAEFNFSEDDDADTNFARWAADLKRWATAFSEHPDDVDIYDKPEYLLHRAEEDRRREAIHQALREIEPWWDALWD